MDYRIIPEEDVNQVLNLKEYCFVSTHDANQLAETQAWLRLHVGLGGYDGKNLVSQLFILPLHMNIFGVKFSMGGIGIVSTYPEYRNGGITKQLLQESFVKMKENGQVLSVLSPFSIGFYRHFGYEVFFENSNYTIPVEKMELREKAEGKVVRFDYSSENYEKWMPKVIAFHEEQVKEINGHMHRDERWWNRLKQREPKAHFAVSLDKDGNVQAYIRYFLNKPKLEIEDFYTKNIEAKRILWQFVQSHHSQIEEVIGRAPISDSFGYHLKEPFSKQELFYDKMIRIIDVKEFLKQYPFEKLTKSLYVKIHDRHAEWNNQVYKIDTNGEVTNPQAVAQEKILEMDIGPFSAMMTGYHGLAWYRENGYIQVSGEAAAFWQMAIPIGFPRFNDFF